MSETTIEKEQEVRFVKGNKDKDFTDIIELCGTWWEDSLFYKLYGVPYKVDRQMFELLFKADALIYTCGRTPDDKLISCYVGIKTKYMFNKDFDFASEVVWCVHKEYRSYKNVVGILDAIDQLMMEHNIILWNINVSNEICYDKTGKFLERMGYKFLDKCYSMYKGDHHG